MEFLILTQYGLKICFKLGFYQYFTLVELLEDVMWIENKILEFSGEWDFHLSVTYKPSHCLLHTSPWSRSERAYLPSHILRGFIYQVA